MTVERTHLLCEQAPRESYRPTADWFKQKLDPAENKRITDAVRARRSPEVVARPRSGQSRTIIARRKTTRKVAPSERQTRIMPALKAQPTAPKNNKASTYSTQVLPHDFAKRDLSGSKPSRTALASQVTRRLAKQKVENLLFRKPLLHELVNVTGNSFLSKFPAGSSINGAPGNKQPHKNATTTAKVGLVTQQGGVVPDKAKRAIKLPEPEEIPSCRDGITKQFERQSAFPMLSRSRTKLLGG